MNQEKSNCNKKLKRISCQADNNGHIGTIKRMKGDLVSAEECYNTATEINLKLNRKHGLAKNMGDIGMVLLERMEYEEAKIFMSQALELSHEVNNQDISPEVIEIDFTELTSASYR